jgi:hypothetical protein
VPTLLQVFAHLLQLLTCTDGDIADVSRDCDPGPFEEAVRITLKAGAGLSYSGEVQVPIFPDFSFDSEADGLYYWSPSLDVCFDISDDADDDEWSPSDTPDTLQEGAQPEDSGFGLGNSTDNVGAPGYETGVYDCSTVAASLGGQPCGGVVMQCPDAYHWSCGNGQEGIVPPGTFCAW